MGGLPSCGSSAHSNCVYVCSCVYACVCEREIEKKREKERERVFVYTYIYVHVLHKGWVYIQTVSLIHA